jgi:hypothetical protein
LKNRLWRLSKLSLIPTEFLPNLRMGAEEVVGGNKMKAENVMSHSKLQLHNTL